MFLVWGKNRGENPRSIAAAASEFPDYEDVIWKISYFLTDEEYGRPRNVIGSQNTEGILAWLAWQQLGMCPVEFPLPDGGVSLWQEARDTLKNMAEMIEKNGEACPPPRTGLVRELNYLGRCMGNFPGGNTAQNTIWLVAAGLGGGESNLRAPGLDYRIQGQARLEFLSRLEAVGSKMPTPKYIPPEEEWERIWAPMWRQKNHRKVVYGVMGALSKGRGGPFFRYYDWTKWLDGDGRRVPLFPSTMMGPPIYGGVIKNVTPDWRGETKTPEDLHELIHRCMKGQHVNYAPQEYLVSVLFPLEPAPPDFREKGMRPANGFASILGMTIWETRTWRAPQVDFPVPEGRKLLIRKKHEELVLRLLSRNVHFDSIEVVDA